MTIRDVVWVPPTPAEVQRLPKELKGMLRTLVADLATGPIPPRDAIPDPYIAEAYEFHSSELIVKFTIYPDAVHILVVRVNT